MTKRILAIDYSQSGDVAKATEAFLQPLRESSQVQVVKETLKPTPPYPYPWKTFPKLMSVFPECILGCCGEIEPLAFSPTEKFDLIILGYQVWHLSPSLPMQAFFKSKYADVLNQTKVITLCVSRNMWHSASEKMKQMVREKGAYHLDNIVVTHQGPPFATFITVPRALLFGKRDRLWGVFPPAEIDKKDFERLRKYGEVIVEKLDMLDASDPEPMLRGLKPVKVNRRYILPEFFSRQGYQFWARVVKWLEKWGAGARTFGIYLSIANLLLAIFVFTPLLFVVRTLFYPLIHRRIDRYARRLAAPSGED